ncbi:hypothetical protein GCAAIG_05225 [Candidatus Electronema halotolerans]
MKRHVSYGVLAVLCAMSFNAAAFAEEMKQEAQTASADEGWLSNGAALGVPWWTKNPKKLAFIPEPLLYHVELSYSYSKTSGNTDVEDQSGSGTLYLRKNIVSSETYFDVSKNETTDNFSSADAAPFVVESQTFGQELIWSVTDVISLLGGGLWRENDSQRYIDSSQTYYAGARTRVLDTPQFNLSLTAAYGYMDSSYQNDRITAVYSDFQPVDDYDSGVLNFNVDFRWMITDKITFSESATYLHDIDNTDYYWLNSTSKLDFKITDNLSFFTEYNCIAYQSPLIEQAQDFLDAKRAQGIAAGDMETVTSKISAGITVSF